MKCDDFGVRIGVMRHGALNKITDVAGVKVGHYTLNTDLHKTGITVIMPCEDIFFNKLRAAVHIQNGYGKTSGLMQIDELGTLETPIALTSTFYVGTVFEGMVRYISDDCTRRGVRAFSVNPLICECNDANLNKNEDFPLKASDVLYAINDARVDFEEGSVGGGTGMYCHQLKGGIGSSSRLVNVDGKDYTVGILVMSNYGQIEDLIVNGDNIGERIQDVQRRAEGEEHGSIIVIMATDAPLDSRQIKRTLKRCVVGLSRCGSFIGCASGDVFAGFSTYDRNDFKGRGTREMTVLDDNILNPFFRAVAEATEEAVLNSLLAAPELTVGFSGMKVYGLKKYMHMLRQ